MKDIKEPENTSSAYGKFKSAEQLLTAYNALEREFTKRCQLLKALQAAEELRSAQEVEEAERTETAAEKSPSKLVESDASAVSDSSKAAVETVETDEPAAALTAVAAVCAAPVAADAAAQRGEETQDGAAAQADAITQAVEEKQIDAADGKSAMQSETTSDETTTQDQAPFVDTQKLVELAVENAELLAAVPQIMDACILRYKKKLIGHNGGVVRGAAVMTPVKRPHTLAEAKALADEMLK